ncbi:MauE/DoxX family redox-associated membrane protein [Pseudonocardia humida]|uniref:Methylamine utilisation protein MauE domain-containing protein n=1 Tax=Pseudonocardia humida TaxID=2800819 RepID=A0ABT1A2F3_9PSEU|nr:MauE/DoxX family redox-associated membrane protein [Pseudonocardia humida]MCO1657172.1 hypothetical protein [Pseudonocardia humida]
MVAEAVFLVARVVVGGMFLVALVSKARDLPSFRTAVRGFGVVPRRLERPVVAAVLGAEAAVVLLLVGRSSAAVGLGAAALLLTAFATGMARVLARGDRVPCGCFGRSTAPIGRAHVWRNGLLAGAAVTGLVAGASSHARLDGPVLLVVSLFAAAVVVVLVLSDQLLAVPEPPPRRPHRPPVGNPSTGATRKR